MSDLIKFSQGGLPANPDELVGALENVGGNLQASAGGVPFLRLLKSGVYAYGPENIEPTDDSEWAINPYSLMHGWACWGEGELLDERMVPANQQVPARGSLPELGEPWSQQVSMQLQCVTGEDTGQVVLYKGTSLGLRNAVKELINALITQIKADPNNIVPVVELRCDSYQHKTYGQTFYPELPIVRWVSIADGETVNSDRAIEADEATATVEPEAAAPEQDSEPPKRRGRRGSRNAEAGSGEDAAPPRRQRRQS